MGEVKTTGYVCERCGHAWTPRGKEVPKICPSCKSKKWNEYFK